MVKKKQTPTWKAGLFGLTGIFLFLLTSTLFDFAQGDFSSGRMWTAGVAITALISIAFLAGTHKIIVALKRQMGM